MSISIIKQLKEGHNFSSNELALLLGTTRSTISMVETGERDLPDSTSIRLAVLHTGLLNIPNPLETPPSFTQAEIEAELEALEKEKEKLEIRFTKLKRQICFIEKQQALIQLMLTQKECKWTKRETQELQNWQAKLSLQLKRTGWAELEYKRKCLDWKLDFWKAQRP